MSNPFKLTTKLWQPDEATEAYWRRCMERITPMVREEQNRDPIPYEGCLKSFAELPLKDPRKWQFCILCFMEQWPDTVALERDGVLNDWLFRMVRGLCWSKRLLMMGCGSSSKTFTAACYTYTLWKSQNQCTSIYLSTTSQEAGESRTWGAIKDLHKADKWKMGKRIESLHVITLDEELRGEDGEKERDYRNAIRCVNIKTGQEGKNAVSAIVGRKNTNVVWVADEMPFMDVGVLNARVNLNTNRFHQFIGLGNAPEEGDPFYIDATPFGEKFPDGWRSVDKDVDQSWPTETGLCLYFNGTRSPNYKVPGKIPFPWLMNENMRKEILQDARGEDTPIYWKQFYGFPPGVDISDKMLTVKLMANNFAFSGVRWKDNAHEWLAGLDLGFRADGDPCVVHFGKVGVGNAEEMEDGEMRKVLCVEADGIPLVPRQGGDAFEVQIAKQVVDKCAERRCAKLALDVTGDGGILLQHIDREARERSYKLEILPVSFSGLAEERIVIPGERRTAREMFANMVCQLWAQVRLGILNRVIHGLSRDAYATRQLCARKMGTDEKKRMTIEPKKEMKKRIRRSPDQGDALAVLVHLALRNGLAGQKIVGVVKKPFDPQKILRDAEGNGGGGMYRAEHRTVYSSP